MKKYFIICLIITFIYGCGKKKEIDFSSGDFVNAYKNEEQVSKNPLDKIFSKSYIKNLKDRHYDGGQLRIIQKKYEDKDIVLNTIMYESDGLNITGLMAEPLANQDKKLGGIVICHGYYPANTYFQGQGTEETIKTIAKHGYVVLMTDYRGYAASEGKNKLGYPGEFIDVMNAIKALKKYKRVDADKLGVIGYSWGGGFALKSIILSKDLKCGVLYYPEIGGINKPKTRMYNYLLQMGSTEEMIDDYFKQWSPMYYTSWINIPVLIFQGAKDRVVSLEQSKALESVMRANKKDVELIVYDDLEHAFADSPDNPSMKKLFKFLNKYLQ